MIFKFQSCQIYYQIKGKSSKPVILLLHGWGQDNQCFNDLKSHLKGMRSVSIDFPPFGKSQQCENWTIFTYANMLISLCEHLNLKNITLLGHSFGGRVAILVAAMRKEIVKKLILVSSAGMKPHRNICYYFRVWKYKMLKKLGFKQKNKGSNDFIRLSEGMKKTFINVVNTHLEQYCPLIECPTLIVFGKQDTETPIYMARRLQKLISNSKLELIDFCGHFCFLERKIRFYQIVDTFLQERNG